MFPNSHSTQLKSSYPHANSCSVVLIVDGVTHCAPPFPTTRWQSVTNHERQTAFPNLSDSLPSGHKTFSLLQVSDLKEKKLKVQHSKGHTWSAVFGATIFCQITEKSKFFMTSYETRMQASSHSCLSFIKSEYVYHMEYLIFSSLWWQLWNHLEITPINKTEEMDTKWINEGFRDVCISLGTCAHLHVFYLTVIWRWSLTEKIEQKQDCLPLYHTK